MLSASEAREILDKVAKDAGIQIITPKDYGNEYHDVFYFMEGSESYFMHFTRYRLGYWSVNVADRILCRSSDNKILTTGNMTIYPKGFDAYAVEMIRDRLVELITNFTKAMREMKLKLKNQKLKEIANAGGEYVV